MACDISKPPATRFRSRRKALIHIKTHWFAAGLFVWAAAFAGTAAGGELGDVPAGGFRSPEGDSRFSPEAGVKPINNLVFELLNVESPGSTKHKFRTPREGWVHLRVPSISQATDQPAVILDDQQVALKKIEGHFEAMRYISEGLHTVGITPGSGSVGRLEVRAIGELFYAAYGSDPHIPEIGVYSWDYLRRHCLDHYNCMIGANSLTPNGQSTQEAEIKEWTSAGKRWYTLHPRPMFESADEVFDFWTRTPGMSHPLMHGIWADEFGPGRLDKYYPYWVEALRRIHADPKFKDRKLYAYCPSRFIPISDYSNGAAMFPFIKTIMDNNYRLGPEWYLPEGRSRPGRIIAKTGDLLAEFSPGWEQAGRESYEKVSPGASTNRVVVLSLLSEPGWETGDLYPNYDYNVFLDAQFQFLATDPSFFGIRGVQGYLTSYCGEEQVRLFAKLVRHYAIEGNTKRMLQDPYVLTHLQNPDFEDGTKGWTLTSAVAQADEPSIVARTVPGFGVLQARYQAPKGLGDTALWTRRSAEKPNVISQQIQNLTPGRLYSLRLITGNYQELTRGTSERRKHAITVRIKNTEPVIEKCFQATTDSGTTYPFGSFHQNNPYWLNYHQHVFRATEAMAHLELLDWNSDQTAGGPAGEELIWNYIQVQPYQE